MNNLNLNNILLITNELKAESGKLKKESILKREINNEEFKLFIKYTLCPMYTYGLQAKKLKKFLGKTDGTSNFNKLSDVFEYLTINSTGRDVDAELTAKFIDSQPEEFKDLLVEATTKTLRMGIDKTVNKAWGKGFLEEFNLMLAKDFYKEMHKIKGKKFILTEKVDGMRIAAIIKDGEVKIFTRQGKVVTGLHEIEQELLKLNIEGVFDGELLIKNEHLYKDRAVLQETLKLSRKDGVKTDLNFHVFDYLTNEEFQNGESEAGYISRRTHMQTIFNRINKHEELEHIHLLPVLYEGDDIGIIAELLAELEEEGKEGLMLNLDRIYSCKRSGNILKIKSMRTFDEFCTGVFEGEGKYKGMLGGINMMYKGEYPLKIGSGFNDEQRKLYWDNPELIIDKIMEVQYFRESSNDRGGLSVSFPVFKGIRDDKEESSYH